MYLKQIEVGLMQNFNYLVGNPGTKECVYIDPAWEVDRVLKIAEADGYQVTKILLTHQHFDHVEGVPEAVEKTRAQVYIHEADRDAAEVGDVKLKTLQEGDKFVVGALTFKVLHTPGHTPGSVCYHVFSSEDPIGCLFTGDTLFQGNCGRSDLPGGNPKILYQSLQRLKSLDPSLKIYPGHDYGIKPVTTVSYEKSHNLTLKASDFETFDRLP